MFTKIEVCDPPCVNGVCEENNQCHCMPGWTGILCNNGIVLLNYIIYIYNSLFIFSATCIPDCVNGECIGPNICDCDPGWTGDRCREG